jgi:glutamate dehydrogenase
MEQLIQKLKNSLNEISKAGQWQDKTLHGLTMNEFAQELFGRASRNFIESQTSDDLLRIANTCAEAVDQFQNKNNVIIKTFSGKNFCELVIILGDRPFIINTINECLRSTNTTKLEHLHPIVTAKKQLISVSYLRLDNLSANELTKLSETIVFALEDLTKVTDDFSAMIAANETLIRILGNPKYSAFIPYNQQKELSEFLRWLENGAFVFLGYSKAACTEKVCNLEGKFSLGLMRSNNPAIKTLSEIVNTEINALFEAENNFTLTKIPLRSTVHRFSRMLALFVREYSSNGETLAIHCLVGLLTSKALSQEVSGTPLVRAKIADIAKMRGLLENSFDYKNIIALVDCLPKDEALIMSTPALQNLLTDLSTQSLEKNLISTRLDISTRGTTVLVILPKERFSSLVRQKIQEHIATTLDYTGNSIEYHLNIGEKPEARLYFFFPDCLPNSINTSLLEKELEVLCRTWQDELSEELQKLSPPDFDQFATAFNSIYQSSTTIKEALTDIALIKNLNSNTPCLTGVSIPNEASPKFTIKLFSLNQERTLSSVVPILENIGFNVIREEAFTISPKDSTIVYLQRYSVESRTGFAVTAQQFDDNIGPALVEILGELSKNDALNALLVDPGLTIAQVKLLRCYCEYFWQINKSLARGTMFNALSSEPTLAKSLWSIFNLRFNPAINKSLNERAAEELQLTEQFIQGLHMISDISKDKMFRSLLQLINKTQRTNFFQQNIKAIAIKLRSDLIDFMPTPRPMFEIYSNAAEFEAVHLRTAAVSRGGIRWSDRVDDFRHEVLGLMKTQRVKNALIVPNGAKGGFIVRNLPADRAQAQAKARTCYQDFIRSLLSITDNYVQGQLIKPKDVICYDGDDPYLVVAADKGTATYSDFANQIAVEEFNFWLGDAFASGGSNGYDHKVVGITARGAWECTKRHFLNLGMNYEQDPFTVVGIGDMSGDVFGNGLILSRNIKLIAAFNHRHIFIDPNPDPEQSFLERERLFKMPSSQWSDYNPSILSTGAAIYNRFDKSIKLSSEAQSALGLTLSATQELTGEELITAVLKAPVDLLWNGGIGTYFKATSETNAGINDSTNDGVRINANELRARVVAEGGNLGFSQLARIEYAKSGGHINTDAIDNSGGVNLSDHEVNIKLLLNQMIASGKFEASQRNTFLRSLTEAVAISVLQHNREHALTLTVAERRSKINIHYFASLIKELSRQKYVDRALEQLPTEEELFERERLSIGLTRPELAVIFATVKLQTKDVILNSKLIEDPWLERYLLAYFPPELSETYKESVQKHPLRMNLIATEVTNSLIDSLGLSFIHRTCMRHAVTPLTVIRCSLAARELLSDPILRIALWKLDSLSNAALLLEIRQEILRALQEITSWLISVFGDQLELDQLIRTFESDFNNFSTKLLRYMPATLQQQYHQRSEYFFGLGFTSEISAKLAVLPFALEIIQISECRRNSGSDYQRAINTFYETQRVLQLSQIASAAMKITARDRWENELVIKCRDELHLCLLRVTEQLLSAVTSVEEVEVTLRASSSFNQLMILLEDLSGTGQTPASLAAISRQLLNFNVID